MLDVTTQIKFRNNKLAIGGDVLHLRRNESVRRLISMIIKKPESTMDDFLNEVYRVRRGASDRLRDSLRKRCTKMISRLRKDLKCHFDADNVKNLRFLAFDRRNLGYQLCVPT
jgi:hypothetical protein